MFLNLSNHPSPQWPGSQKEAAEALGGQIADHLFPVVPPQATVEQVRELGEGLLQALVGIRPAAAMVQGEFTLTFYFVRELEARGIPCYAATTRRISQEAPMGEGNHRTTSDFEFVQFRRYL